MLDERLNKIISDILEKRSDLTRDQVMNLIEEKKNKVGSGYLTPIGAALLVAGDLDLDISRAEQRQYRLKDLVSGLNGVMVNCYFLKSSGIKDFTRKDGTNSSYRRSLVFDDNIIVKVIEWDALKSSNRMQFSPGEPITIKDASTRTGRDGKIELHLNLKSEVVLDNERPPISIDIISRDVSTVTEISTSLVITGIINENPKFVIFTRKDGKQGNALQFSIASRVRADIRRRVVLWSPMNNLEKLLYPGMFIRLVDIDAKLSTRNEIEFHGGEHTSYEILEIGITLSETSKNNRFFLISVGSQIEGSDRRTVLLSDISNFYTLVVSGKLLDLFSQITIGDILEIKDYAIKDGQIFIPHSLDNITIVGSDEQFISHLLQKIKSINNLGQPCIIEAIALSKAAEKVITTRDGKSLQVTQLVLGDETGEIEISGWGRNGRLIKGIMPGTRLLIYGALPIRGADGIIRLQCKEYTQIKKIID